MDFRIMTRMIEQVMRAAPVFPVIVIDDAAHALLLAEALVAGGLPVLEVRLRTAAAHFGECRLCPAGGIPLRNAGEWLTLDSVLCIGGSRLVPRGSPDVAAVGEAARKAAALAR